MPTQSPSRYFAFLIVLLPAAFIFTLLSFNQEAAASHHIIYVNAAADPGGNSSSWEDAFTDLQDALADATIGDEIWVAAGLYKPTDAPADREASFYLRQGVALYGSFAGDETARDQRDWETNLTVLSGDIDDNDITDPTGIVTDPTNLVGANSYNVVTGSGVNETAVLDGFIITAGHANGSYDTPCVHRCGAGMHSNGGHPTLTNLIFSGNRAVSFGGGMYNRNSSPRLTNVIFNNN